MHEAHLEVLAQGTLRGIEAAIGLEQSPGVHKREGKLMDSLFPSRKRFDERRTSLKGSRSDGGSPPILRAPAPGALDRSPGASRRCARDGPPAPWQFMGGTEEPVLPCSARGASVAHLAPREAPQLAATDAGPCELARPTIVARSQKERMVYNPAKTECQMTKASVPPDTIRE